MSIRKMLGKNGYSYSNFITDGNFTDAANWDKANGTLSCSNNIAIITGDGTSLASRLKQVQAITTGTVYYLRATVNVTNSVSTQIILSWYNGAATQTVYTLTTPSINKLYTISGVITATNTDAAAYVQVVQVYADAGTANGKVLNVREFIAINLTSLFGAGAEPSVSACDGLFNFTDSTLSRVSLSNNLKIL
jgi:hypothetical protein